MLGNIQKHETGKWHKQGNTKNKCEAGNSQDTNQIRQIAKAWTHHRQCWSETSQSNPDSLGYLRGAV